MKKIVTSGNVWVLVIFMCSIVFYVVRCICIRAPLRDLEAVLIPQSEISNQQSIILPTFAHKHQLCLTSPKKEKTLGKE